LGLVTRHFTGLVIRQLAKWENSQQSYGTQGKEDDLKGAEAVSSLMRIASATRSGVVIVQSGLSFTGWLPKKLILSRSTCSFSSTLMLGFAVAASRHRPTAHSATK
jgi:hypothetical protein